MNLGTKAVDEFEFTSNLRRSSRSAHEQGNGGDDRDDLGNGPDLMPFLDHEGRSSLECLSSPSIPLAGKEHVYAIKMLTLPAPCRRINRANAKCQMPSFKLTPLFHMGAWHDKVWLELMPSWFRYCCRGVMVSNDQP